MTTERMSYILGGGFKYFLFSPHVGPHVGKWFILTNILQMGWNHQLVYIFLLEMWRCFWWRPHFEDRWEAKIHWLLGDLEVRFPSCSSIYQLEESNKNHPHYVEVQKSRTKVLGAKLFQSVAKILAKKLGGGFKLFYFHPYLGKISILTNIFQMGWFNHQPEKGFATLAVPRFLDSSRLWRWCCLLAKTRYGGFLVNQPRSNHLWSCFLLVGYLLNQNTIEYEFKGNIAQSNRKQHLEVGFVEVAQVLKKNTNKNALTNKT